MSSREDTDDRRGGERLPHDWEAAYAETPPWDIGRPQTPFIELADAGHLRGTVLDLGCGTGEHTLLAAALGETFDVVVDCGFFHVLPDSARGPRRIRQEEIRTVFAEGFSVDAITESQIEATLLDVPVPAWLATITRDVTR